MRALPVALLAPVLLAGCDDQFGPSRATIEAAVAEFHKPLEGWMIFTTCAPEELRGATIASTGLCRPVLGTTSPAYFCDVEFKLADGSRKHVDVAMRKDPEFGWSADTRPQPVRRDTFFSPCPALL